MHASRTASSSSLPRLRRGFASASSLAQTSLFGIDIEACARCGGKLKVIASIEEPAVIAKILAHLERTALEQVQCGLPLGARAPPVQSSLL
jgi:hypothetical protein